MEIADEPIDDADIGPRLAAGRDSIVYELGDGLVLRRAGNHRSFVAEGRTMEAVRSLGYPIPRVERVGPGEMVLERVAGPTMMQDIASHPWRLDAHARLLADLHTRLHALEPPAGLEPFPTPGDAILHLDLHPLNVILSPDGPVVIDWTNARRGPAGVDLALTWIVLAVFESDDTGIMRLLVAALRRRLVHSFLAAAGQDEAARCLRITADYRGQDRNVRPTELDRLHRLVAQHAT